MRRYLIVNADDFGRSPGVNAGIQDAHERGVVTSATLMVRQPGAEQAAAYARAQPRLSVGLHVDLGEWVHHADGWTARYEVVDMQDPEAVAAEVARQLAAFQALVGRLPTHLDSHQHVHRSEPVASILRDAGRRLSVPVRHQSQVSYRGDFYGQTGKGEPYAEAITLEALLGVVDGLGGGWTEIGCHPGRPEPDLDDVYREERTVELDVLCDAQLRRGLRERGIELVSFLDLPR